MQGCRAVQAFEAALDGTLWLRSVRKSSGLVKVRDRNKGVALQAGYDIVTDSRNDGSISA